MRGRRIGLSSRAAGWGAAIALLLPLAACATGEDRAVPEDAAPLEQGAADDAEERPEGGSGTLSVDDWRQAVRDVATYDSDAVCAELFPDDAIAQLAEFTGPGISRVELIATDEGMTCNYEAFDGPEDSQSVRIELNWNEAPVCERLMSESEDEYLPELDVHDSVDISEDSGNSRIISACAGDTRVQLLLGTLSSSPYGDFVADDGFGPLIADELRRTLPEWEGEVLEAHEAALAE